MPFVQRVVEPKFLSRTTLFDPDGKPLVDDEELQAVINNTLSNALRQLASVVLIADDIFGELGRQLKDIGQRSCKLKERIEVVQRKSEAYDPKKVTVPESDICTFALLKNHYAAKFEPDTNLFTADTRPQALRALYEAATKTPVHLMRQMDRWRRDGHRSSRFFLCTPILGSKRRRIRNSVDIDIETCMPAAVKDLRRWTSTEALGDITVTPDCPIRIASSVVTDGGEVTDGTVVSDDEGIDHTLPSPEEQLQVVALKFPAEIVAVDVSGRSFDRMSVQRRSLMHAGEVNKENEETGVRRRTKVRKPRSRRRNTLAGTDQKEIRDALTAGDEPSCSADHNNLSTASSPSGVAVVSRSKSSDILRSHSNNTTKRDSPDNKKSHFNTLKQWGKTRYDRLMNKSGETNNNTKKDIDDFNIYETVTMKRRRNVVDKRTHERNPSISSSDKSSGVVVSSVMNIAVKLRESSSQRRQRRSGGSKDEPPHSSSGNWSASSESGRASIGSEFTTTSTAQPKSSTSAATSINSLNQPNSVNSRRRFIINTSTSSSVTSEGTLTPDIIHDLHEDGETSSVYSCDTEGYYTSFHMDSGLKTLKEEELPCTPLHSTSAFNTITLTAENEYELFGKGSTSTTTSSAGTVCTTLRASDSSRSLTGCPAVPERKSSLSSPSVKTQSPGSSLERDSSDKTGTVKRSPKIGGDVSPDSGHNTSSSPIESTSSPNGVRSGSEFEFSESSDMEGPERIERIRVKTTINSSRIPSMCVITPPHSDDESVKSGNSKQSDLRAKLELDLNLNLKPSEGHNVLKSSDSDKENRNIIHNNNQVQVINVNPQTGYATLESVDSNNKKILRAPSPSGGSLIIVDQVAKPQPVIKATLLPLNNVLGRLKSNFANLRRDRSKSPSATKPEDCGDYVTLADVRHVQELIYANTGLQANLKTRETEYVSLNELPEVSKKEELCPTLDSLERKRRLGARVTLDAEGKVVYSSDSLRRRKGAHTTFEPGPFVKTPTPSPLPVHRMPKPEAGGKLVIKAGGEAPEIIRVPASTIVAPSTRPMSPKGAYVHMQDRPLSPTHETERVPSPSYPATSAMSYNYRGFDPAESHYYSNFHTAYQTLPLRKTQQFFHYEANNPERSVTPDITRGLEPLDRRLNYDANTYHKIGIPVRMPDVSSRYRSTSEDSLKISPIDPRHSGQGFHSSTPSAKELKAAVNLEAWSPKKSTMSNEELYAVIHKSKKKMNIQSDTVSLETPAKPVTKSPPPETGYLGADKSRSRLSWSPSKGEYVDFNADIDKLSPPNDSRTRQSWACSDRKGPAQTSRLDFKKLLLQKSNVLSTGVTRKLSAVEQLKISKQAIPPMNILELSGSPRSLANRRFVQPPPVESKAKPPAKLMSPRSQWRFASPRSDVLSSTILEDCREDESPNNSSLEKNSSKKSPVISDDDLAKPLSSISNQSTNNHKHGTSSSSYRPSYTSISQRLQAQRAQFFGNTGTVATPTDQRTSSQFEAANKGNGKKCSSPPTLETAF